MNKLSSNEKEQLVKLLCLKNSLKEVIDNYAGLENVDKTLLTELRHGKTRINKAITLLSSGLDEDYIKEYLLFMPTSCECVYLREANQQINIMGNDYKALYERNRNLIQQVEELTLEQINDSLECDSEEETGDYMSIEILLNTGEKSSMCLPGRMVECLMEEIKRPNRLTRSICSQHVNDELITIDMQHVTAIHVTGFPNLDWIRPQPVYEYTTEQERYRVECKCGAEYFCNMNPSRPKARCRDCQSVVYADRGAGKVADPCNKTGATLLTNRYYVEDAPKISEHQENASGRDLRAISKNNGKDYIDPCKILA